jgi:hypothetical protein
LIVFVITADQVDSRTSADRVDEAIAVIVATAGDRLALPPDRTAGDEVQAMTADAAAALDIALALARSRAWSIGLGIGDVRTPLPDATRAATGDAFVLAREAVDDAKQRPTRFRLRIADDRARDDADVEPLVDLLLQQRSRRTDEGWELADLLADGRPQVEAARTLGITPQAVSQRARSAGLRTDDAARAALVRLLTEADAAAENRSTGTETP